jgi:hypothetical protein
MDLMRVSSVLGAFLLAGLSAAALPAADVFAPSGGTPATVKPQPAEEVEAMLRVADTPWLDRELTRFAAALGRDPAPMRRVLAEKLYRTKSLDAIDTARPAVFIWRSGSSPLQAIIPIRAELRRQFVDEFGSMGPGEAPLVRVGDRDGTVIFTQNHPEGLREYRLLVMDSVAFLARNADECRKLMARAPTLLPQVGNSAPVSLVCTGAWLRTTRLLDWTWSSRLPVPSWLPWPAMLDTAQRAVIDQTDRFSFEVRGGAEGRARLSAQLVARPDSELAAWIATQQNQGSRLQAQVGGPDTAIKLTTHITWQDKLELLARAVLPGLRESLGAAWNLAGEEAWMQTFTVAQRSSDAVWCLDVPEPGKQFQTLVIEQPRAEEQIGQLDRVSSALNATAPTGATITGYAAARRAVPAQAGRPALNQLIGATAHQVLLVDGWNVTDAEVQARAEATARRLQQVGSAAAEPAVVSLWCNFGRLVRLAPGTDPEVTIPDAVLQGFIRTVGVTTLQCDLMVSLNDAAVAFGHLPDDPNAKRRP